MRNLILCLGILAGALAPAAEKVSVVTSLPDLAWAAQQIGKEFVDAKALLGGSENPHFVDAVPRFISAVADAKLVCIVGLDLEVGWMPKVLTRSGNASVQPGGSGYCETGRAVSILEKPAGTVDRSMGDVHPQGNPHYWLSPHALAEGAREIRDGLVRVDPSHAAAYRKNYDSLASTLEALQKKNKDRLAKKLAGLKTPAMEYHREFTYFFDAYGLKSFGSIEEKPGVPPSAGRIAEIAIAAKAAGVKVALAGPYAPDKTLSRFTELSGVPVKSVPTSIQPKGKIADYVELQDYLVGTVLESLSGASTTP